MAPTERREIAMEASANKPVEKAPFSKRHPIIAGFGKAVSAGIFLLGVSCATDTLPRPHNARAPQSLEDLYCYGRFYQIGERIEALVSRSNNLDDPRIFDRERFPDTAREVLNLYWEIKTHFADIDALLAGGTLSPEQATFLNNMKTIVSSALSALRQQNAPLIPFSVVCEVVPDAVLRYHLNRFTSLVVAECPQPPSRVPDSPPDLMLGLPVPALTQVQTGVPVAGSDGKSPLILEMGLQGNPLGISTLPVTDDAPLTIGPLFRF